MRSLQITDVSLLRNSPCALYVIPNSAIDVFRHEASSPPVQANREFKSAKRTDIFE